MSPAVRDATGGPGMQVVGAPPLVAPGARVLLVGIGNDLRGDDGAGPAVVRALEGRVDWSLRVVHGLTPELADEVGGADLALFVDAAADPTLDAPTWTHHGPPEPGAGGRLLGHALEVSGVLAWCAALHGRTPSAATLSLPARDFALGETLSPTAELGVAVADAALLRLARR